MSEKQRPTVTVGFYMRERLAASAESLASVVANTVSTHALVIVDCNVPERYRKAMEGVVAGRPNVHWIRTDRFLTVNESRNLIANATDDDYVCFVENAALVSPGWLEALVDACETFPAGAATPTMHERTGNKDIPHHDFGFARLEVGEERGSRVYRCMADNGARADRFDQTAPFRITATEGHCNFFSRAALQAVGPFDESLAAGTHIDISCALLDKGITLLQVPGSVVTHLPCTNLEPEEREFYAFRWNVEKAAASRDKIVAKWNLRNIADLEQFAIGQAYRVHPLLWQMHRVSRLPVTLRQRFGQGA